MSRTTLSADESPSSAIVKSGTIKNLMRPIESVVEENALCTLNLFRSNRGLPVCPSPTDIYKWKTHVQILHGSSLETAKRTGVISRTKTELETKSFATEAVNQAVNNLTGIGGITAPIPEAQPAIAGADAPMATRPAEFNLLAEARREPGNDLLDHLVFPRAVRPPEALWHPKWKLKTVIAGHTGWVRCLDVDPSNEWFVSGGNDRLIKIWDLASGTLKLSLTGHVQAIRGVIVSPRHPYLFSCSEDNTVKCWDLEANKVIRHYHGHLSGVYTIALHPTVDVLASGGRDASVRIWDIRTRQAVHVLSGHQSTVFTLASQSIEPQLISGSADNMIRCWDLRTGKCAVVLTHHSKSVRSVAIHPRQYSFLSAAGDAVKIWNGENADYERDLNPCKSIINTVAIKDDPESCVVVAGTDSGHLHFWDWRSGKRFQTIESIPQPGSLASENAIFAAKFDKSETRLITAECDKSIKIWQEDMELDLDEQQQTKPQLQIAR